MILPAVKRCVRCREYVSVELFNRNAKSSDGLGAYCRPCAHATEKAWREANPERKRAGVTRWRHANPEKKKAIEDRYRNTPAGRDVIRRRNGRRRAIEAGVPNNFTRDQHEDLLRVYKGLCYVCRAPATSLDHVVPVSKGGPHTAGNLRPACTSCNSRKRHTDLLEWLESKWIRVETESEK